MVQSPSDRLKSHWPRSTQTDRPREEETPSKSAPDWTQRLAKSMGEHPALTLAAAALVGVVLGWMVKRK
jgi:hypothetical protein